MRVGIIFLLALLALSSFAAAERVGVYVEFPNGAVYKDCITTERNANAYGILKQTGLAMTWTNHPGFRHSLCAIFDVGCKQTACSCGSKHWNFYTQKANGSWTYSPVGYDGGSSCKQHYCAKEGDILGFNFNSDGKPPSNATFSDLCPTQPEKITQPDIIGNVIAFPAKNAGYISAAFVMLLLVGYFVYKPWQYI
jgi:hypothetical protein